MKADERSRVLMDRVMDHLVAQGFKDEESLLYVTSFVTYEKRVLVGLTPYVYGCDTCEAKGFVPKLVDAFKQRIRPTWCVDCVAVTDVRWNRQRELVPRLRAALEGVFVMTETSPDNPFTSFLVSS